MAAASRKRTLDAFFTPSAHKKKRTSETSAEGATNDPALKDENVSPPKTKTRHTIYEVVIFAGTQLIL